MVWQQDIWSIAFCWLACVTRFNVCLQDRVPPFSSTEAYKVIERCVGQSVRKAFVRISPAPVASASLGQVYRATLSEGLGGQEVAVKVQRPHVLAQVALDLFLMRWVALASQKLPQVRVCEGALLSGQRKTPAILKAGVMHVQTCLMLCPSAVDLLSWHSAGHGHQHCWNADRLLAQCCLVRRLT